MASINLQHLILQSRGYTLTRARQLARSGSTAATAAPALSGTTRGNGVQHETDPAPSHCNMATEVRNFLHLSVPSTTPFLPPYFYPDMCRCGMRYCKLHVGSLGGEHWNEYSTDSATREWESCIYSVFFLHVPFILQFAHISLFFQIQLIPYTLL